MIYLKDEKLLNDRMSNGLLLLPFFRLRILNRINDLDCKLDIVESRRNKIHKYIKFVLNFIRYIPKFKFRDTPLIFFSSTLADISINDKYFFNQLHGYYKNILPNISTIIEDGKQSFEWNIPNLDKTIVYFNSYIDIICKAIAYVYSKIYLSKSVKCEVMLDDYNCCIAEKEIITLNYYYILLYKVYDYIFKKCSKVKIIFVNCGMYGGSFASIIKAAHDNNILVAEIQHGMTNGIHLAYNYEEFIFENEEYRTYLPDYFLTYGQFWNETTHIPVAKFVIGNKLLNDYKGIEIKKSNLKTILIISQPDRIYKVLLDFALLLAHTTSDYRIVWRTHPMDKINQEDLNKVKQHNIIHHTYKCNLYEDIIEADYVVGWTTTVLFEAIGLNKEIYIIDDEFSRQVFSEEVGTFITTVEYFMKVIHTNKSKQRTLSSDYFYADNFEENYKNFLIKTNVSKDFDGWRI